jgi:catechol 2,3-dioxygenase-like lactoylglutathione lyase family enzyme
MSAMLRLDHVQIAIPAGAEAACRQFYVEVLGMTELAKPAELAKRGGLWVRSGAVEIHLGVERTSVRPARRIRASSSPTSRRSR